MRSIAIAVLLLGSARFASADEPTVAEPNSFLGINLGVPATEQFADCSTADYDDPEFEQSLDKYFEANAKGTPCFSRIVDEYAELINPSVPEIGIEVLGILLSLTETNVVEGVSVSLRHYDWTKMRDLLTARFGNPQSEERANYANAGGGQIQGLVHTWIWPGLSITLAELGDNVEESAVYVVTKRLEQWREQQSLENAARNKDKL